MNSSTGGRPPFGPSRRPRNNTTIPSTLEPYYSANIFRYKCIGQLKLSSDHVGSPGICRGLQFQTELVAKMQPGTREQCIKRFLDASADYSEAESEEDAADQKVKEIYTSRTLIYRDDTEDDVVNYIEYDDNKDGDDSKNSNNKRHNSSRMIVKKKTVPEEDLIDKTSWSCNGSTNVHYLVLKPETNPPASAAAAAAAMLQLPPNLITENNNNNNSAEKKSASKNNNNNNSNNNNNNNGKIVAITPDNIGIAVRKIDSQVGHFTMIDFGSIRICLETPASAVSDDNDDDDNKNVGGTKEEKELQHQQQLSQQKNNNVANNNAATLEQSGQKVYDFSLKMIRHMNQNQKMLRDAVADDFPARAMVFGHKIINRFGKTVDQTWEYMGKMIDMVWKGSGGGSGRF